MSSKYSYFVTFFVIILSVDRTYCSTSLYDPFEASRVALDFDVGQITQALTWGAVILAAVFTGIGLFSCFSTQVATKRKYLIDDDEEEIKVVESTGSKNSTTTVVKDKDGKIRKRRTLPDMKKSVNEIIRAINLKREEYGF